jgi:hypothetical protein
LTAYRGRRVLQSWTGTMFEYLMPNLWMRTYSRTILEQSSRAAVEIQRLYLRGKRVPWGISESAHAATDANGCYQYHAFGLPALALKRAKEPPHVLAPYASFLALESFPASAVGNLRKMSKRGWAGGYGFYDAIDFEDTQTIWREPRVVRSWMAHHQAMSLMAVANRLLDRPFQQYFHTEPQVMATELLLQERIPGGMKVETEPVIGPSGLVTPLKQVAA